MVEIKADYSHRSVRGARLTEPEAKESPRRGSVEAASLKQLMSSILRDPRKAETPKLRNFRTNKP